MKKGRTKQNSSFAAALVLLLLFISGCGGGISNNHPIPQLPVTEPVSHEKFTLIAFPDTQYMTLGYPNLLTTMTQWVVDNKDGLNIPFMLHEGDMTHKNTQDEWDNAVTSMSVLDGEVPYAICVGNHDIASGGDTSKYNAAFPVSKFQGETWFGGVYETGKLDNSYYFFTAGGTDWLVLSLIYNPDENILAWASTVAAANPTRRVIILTHAHLGISGTRTSIGDRIWDNLAKLHKNVTFVFNGHYLGTEGSRLVSDGDNGNKVYQMFANYQDRAFGGSGLLRIIEVDRDAKTVSVKTYSAWQSFYETDDRNQFTFEDVELGPP